MEEERCRWESLTLGVLAFVLGWASLLAQIVLIRELTVTFYDFELFLGICLGLWLFWVGVGAFSTGLWVDGARISSSMVALSLGIAGSLVPVAVFAARLIHGKVSWITFPGVFAYGSLVLGPPCVAFGIAYGFAAKLLSSQGKPDGSGGVRVYALESLGGLVAGVGFGLLMVPRWGLFRIAWLVCLVCGVTAFAAAFFSAGRRRSGRLWALAATAALLGTWFTVEWTGLAKRVDRASTELRWAKYYHHVYSKSSRYSDVEVLERRDSGARLFAVNHVVMWSEDGGYYHNEQIVHFTLAALPDPRNIVLIGGGVGGSLVEALKHPLERASYVEIDPVVVDVAKRFFRQQTAAGFSDPRTRIWNEDGRRFLRRYEDRFDAVLVDFGDPYVAQMARLYSREFFQEVFRALRSPGILTIQLFPGTDRDWFGRDETWEATKGIEDLNRSIYKTLASVFPTVWAIPGHYDFLLACKGPVPLPDAETVLRRLEARGVQTNTFNEVYVRGVLDEEYRKQKTDYLLDSGTVALHSDWKPVLLRYDADYWGQRWYGKMLVLLRWAWRLQLWHVGVALGLLALWGWTVGKRGGSPRAFRGMLVVAVGLAGFWLMAMELLVLYQYSVQHGVLFSVFGVLFAFLLGGLGLGNLVGMRAFRDNSVDGGGFFWALPSLSLVMLLAFELLGRLDLGEWQAGCLAAAFLGACGFSVGRIFARAVWNYNSGTDSATLLYASDLAGGAAASMVVMVVALPSMGFAQCLVALVAVGACTCWMLNRSAR